MFLPSSYGCALGMMLTGMVLWGSWANTYRLVKNWPFGFFYLDYAVGIFLTSLVLAAGLGSGFSAETFSENLRAADAGAVIYALTAGVVWNLGNLLLVAAMRLVGMAVAFPVSIGSALVLGACGSYIVTPRGNPLLLFSGIFLVLAAVILNSMAWRETAARRGTAAGSGLWICMASGALFSASGPLLALAQSTPRPIAPYGLAVLYTLGALVSAIPLTMPLFAKLAPDKTAAVQPRFWSGTATQHAAGLSGGVLWGVGTVLTFVPMSMVGTALAYAIGYSNPLIAAVWGTFVWREFRGASRRVNRLIAGMFFCYLTGLLLQSSSFLWQ